MPHPRSPDRPRGRRTYGIGQIGAADDVERELLAEVAAMPLCDLPRLAGAALRSFENAGDVLALKIAVAAGLRILESREATAANTKEPLKMSITPRLTVVGVAPTLRTLFLEHQRLEYRSALSDDENDAACDHQFRLARQIAAMPAESPRQVAMKLKVLSIYVDEVPGVRLLLASILDDLDALDAAG